MEQDNRNYLIVLNDAERVATEELTQFLCLLTPAQEAIDASSPATRGLKKLNLLLVTDSRASGQQLAESVLPSEESKFTPLSPYIEQ
ncbi:hypothetical protein CEE45_04805 [Candidatus Heimdallarchaeota archaeon B3_Heim]|nr:MAG: hypothetical protein CEE45_04805 [Candidatus Heimdallarchaeota archaeon B3_Heim]